MEEMDKSRELFSKEGDTVTFNKYSDKFVFAIYFIQSLIFSKQCRVVIFASIFMK